MHASAPSLPNALLQVPACALCLPQHSAVHAPAFTPFSPKPYFPCALHPMPAGGASPRHIQQRLSHLSTGRQHARVTLSAAAVTAWLAAHPAAASGIASLSLDLSHHAGSSDFDTASLDRLLQKLPKVTRVTMAGAVEGTDAYEPIGGCCWGRRVVVAPAQRVTQRCGVWFGCSPCRHPGLLKAILLLRTKVF